jgi:hypothetical protein
MTSWMLLAPVSSMTKRSMPMPSPPVGGIPNSKDRLELRSVGRAAKPVSRAYAHLVSPVITACCWVPVYENCGKNCGIYWPEATTSASSVERVCWR